MGVRILSPTRFECNTSTLIWDNTIDYVYIVQYNKPELIYFFFNNNLFLLYRVNDHILGLIIPSQCEECYK